MTKHDDNFYHAVIKHAFPDAHNIRQPKTVGWVAPAIYIIDTADQTLICKFNHQDIILHNKHISDILTHHNIPIPKTVVHDMFGTWFETYQYRHEKTLHELIENGISDEHIFTAYKKALEIQHKISQIDTTKTIIPHCPRYFDIIKRYPHLSLYHKIQYYMSVLGKQYLLHNDIHPKNILYSPETREAYLIDLDSISTSNFGTYAFRFVRDYPGKNYDELAQEYQRLTGHRINIPAIQYAYKILTIPGKIKRKLTSIIDKQK